MSETPNYYCEEGCGEATEENCTQQRANLRRENAELLAKAEKDGKACAIMRDLCEGVVAAVGEGLVSEDLETTVKTDIYNRRLVVALTEYQDAQLHTLGYDYVHKSEIEKAEKACQEGKAIIKAVLQDDADIGFVSETNVRKLIRWSEDTDSGHDYISIEQHKSEVEKLQQQLRGLREHVANYDTLRVVGELDAIHTELDLPWGANAALVVRELQQQLDIRSGNIKTLHEENQLLQQQLNAANEKLFIYEKRGIEEIERDSKQ